jgi:hypothetical protein
VRSTTSLGNLLRAFALAIGHSIIGHVRCNLHAACHSLWHGANTGSVALIVAVLDNVTAAAACSCVLRTEDPGRLGQTS